VSNKNKSFNFLILQQQTNLNNVFGGIEDSLFARAEALADRSPSSANASPTAANEPPFHTQFNGRVGCQLKSIL